MNAVDTFSFREPPQNNTMIVSPWLGYTGGIDSALAKNLQELWYTPHFLDRQGDGFLSENTWVEKYIGSLLQRVESIMRDEGQVHLLGVSFWAYISLRILEQFRAKVQSIALISPVIQVANFFQLQTQFTPGSQSGKIILPDETSSMNIHPSNMNPRDIQVGIGENISSFVAWGSADTYIYRNKKEKNSLEYSFHALLRDIFWDHPDTIIRCGLGHTWVLQDEIIQLCMKRFLQKQIVSHNEISG